MKKKILLLAVMVAVLSCIFAVSVSAKTITYEGQEIELIDNLGDPSWYTGDTAIAIKDKESVVILKDSEGNMTAYPSYYVLKFGVDMKDGVPSNVYVLWDDQNGVDYSFINGELGTSYVYGSIYYIEFPYGMTCCKNNRLFGRENGGAKETGCVEMVLPDSVNTIEGQAFRMMDSCKRINIPAAVTSLPSWAFCGSTKLETVIFSKGSVLETTGNSFSGCTALSSINIEACTNLKTLGGSAFDGCTSLRKLALPDSLETIGNKTFYKIGEFELASDYLPKNLKTIGTHFLSGCNIQNDVLYFPVGFTALTSEYNFNDGAKYEGTGFTLVFLGKMTTVRIDSMDANTSFKGVQIIFAQNTADEVNGKFVTGTTFNGNHAYIAKDSTGALALNKEVTTGSLTLTLRNNDPNSNSEVGKDANGNKIYSISSTTPRFIFCGGESVDLIYQVRNNVSGWNYYLTTPFAYDVDAHKTAGVHYNSIVYQAGNCGYDETTTSTCVICKLQSVVTGEKATGEHIFTDDFNCETALECDVCKRVLIEALVHNIKTVVGFENGFAQDGSKKTYCQNEGCLHVVSDETMTALFVCFGTSASEINGSCGIVVGFKVNQEAITAYEEATGKAVSYGVFAVLQNKLGANEIFDKDGNMTSGVLGTNIRTSHTVFEIKITGISEDKADAKLALGGYVKTTDGDTVEYSYMQDTTKGEKVGNYWFVSYTDVAGN